jgi:hypothetical protein
LRKLPVPSPRDFQCHQPQALEYQSQRVNEQTWVRLVHGRLFLVGAVPALVSRLHVVGTDALAPHPVTPLSSVPLVRDPGIATLFVKDSLRLVTHQL